MGRCLPVTIRAIPHSIYRTHSTPVFTGVLLLGAWFFGHPSCRLKNAAFSEGMRGGFEHLTFDVSWTLEARADERIYYLEFVWYYLLGGGMDRLSALAPPPPTRSRALIQPAHGLR